MRFVIKDFINDEYSKAVNILKDNLKDHYHVFYGVRLSEILFPSGDYGSEKFFKDFEEINSVTLPIVVFDLYQKKPLAVISFGAMSYSDLIKKVGIDAIACESLSDLFKADLLVNLYREQD